VQASLPGFQCDAGYYLVNNTSPISDACAACAPIPDSNNVNVTCTTQSDSVGNVDGGFACNQGFYGIAIIGKISECILCTPIANSNNVNISCVGEFVCSH
jgi:hypothetical protein